MILLIVYGEVMIRKICLVMGLVVRVG